MSSDSGDASRSFSAKLNHLFATVRPAHGEEASYREVAATIAEQGGPTISPSYIYQLRSGIRENPTLRHVQALAKYFGVEVAYFTDDEIAEQTDAQLATLAAMRDAGVRSIALRAANLSPESLGLVSDMIDVASKMEGSRRRGSRTRPKSQQDRPQAATTPATEPATDVRDSEPD